jgi:hypothetical protein
MTATGGGAPKVVGRQSGNLPFQLLQVRWAHVEVPQRVRMLGLVANRRRLADHPLVVIAEALQVAIDGGGGQPSRREFLKTVRRIDAVLRQ